MSTGLHAGYCGLALVVACTAAPTPSGDAAPAGDARMSDGADASRPDAPLIDAGFALDPEEPIGTLTDEERRLFCVEWIAALGGEGHQVECSPTSTLTVSTVAQCVDRRPAATCPVPVAQGLACAAAMGQDLCAAVADPPTPCEDFYVPACTLQ